MGVRFNGRRGHAALALAVVCIPRGLSYLPPLSFTDAPSAVALVSGVVPYWAWGALWLAVGLLCILAAFRFTEHGDSAVKRGAFAFSSAIALMALWGVAYATSAVLGTGSAEPARELAFAGTLLGFAWFATATVAAPRVVTPPVPEDGAQDG